MSAFSQPPPYDESAMDDFGEEFDDQSSELDLPALRDLDQVLADSEREDSYNDEQQAAEAPRSATTQNGNKSPSASPSARKHKGGRHSLSAGDDGLTRITVYRNGDENFNGRVVPVDPRQIRSFDYLLDVLTPMIKGKFGAVRKLYAYPSGKEVTKLGTLQDGELYVAAGQGRYKRLGYANIVDVHTRERNYVAPDLSSVKRKPLERGVAMHTDEKPLTFSVCASGDVSGWSAKLVLRQREMADMDMLLTKVTEKLSSANKLEVGNVKKLYTFNGQRVINTDQLMHGEMYVAMDHEPLRIPRGYIAADGVLIKEEKRVAKRNATKKKQGPIYVVRSRIDTTIPKSFVPFSSSRPGLKTELLGFETYEEFITEIQKDVETKAQTIALRHVMNDYVVDELIAEVVDEALRDLYTACINLINGYHDHLREQLAELHAYDIDRSYDDLVQPILDYMLRPTNDVFHAPRGDEDKQLASRFGLAVTAALKGRLAHWEGHPTSFAALVILLDQFPRSLYRGTKDMYKGDTEAVEVIDRAEESGILSQVHPVHMLFPCLALSHQEAIESQNRCHELWRKVSVNFDRSDPIWTFAASFESNRKVVKKFGRFPNRNSVLGRESSADEVEYIAATEAGSKKAARRATRKGGKTSDAAEDGGDDRAQDEEAPVSPPEKTSRRMRSKKAH